jgi:hypothetical protein
MHSGAARTCDASEPVEAFDRIGEIGLARREMGFDPGQCGARLPRRNLLDVMFDRCIQDALLGDGGLFVRDQELVAQASEFSLETNLLDLVALLLEHVTLATAILLEAGSDLPG